ncbi:MAG TPA: NAD(P)H-dependent oxidoreductase subunit E [Actinomycetota bacterium]|nr:NAD(P)H-dependent oxidoreductase subunit E [Actinomycetota bacterium]
MTLSPAFHAKAKEVVARYPNPRSALIMLLHDAQDEVGYITDDVIKEVGAVLDLSAADVEGVSTFYTMFKRRHPGTFLISVCTNLSCAVNGAEQTAEALRDAIGPPDKTTPDGLCSWESVECLATCHWAVAAQVNYLDVPYLTPERARKLVNDLRAGRDLDEILSELRQAKSLAEARTSQRNGDAGTTSDG